MTALEGRVSKLEGTYDHLATKADLAELKSDLTSELSSRMSDLHRTLIYVVIGLATLYVAGIAAMAAIFRFVL